MVIFITGASHTGKTALAQSLLEKYHFPYMSMDHLKMGLIRSQTTTLTPFDDRELVSYLWPIVKEIAKTAIENNQNLILEGCYIPFDWEKDFTKEYLSEIRYYCLAMTKEYITDHYSDILKYANTIEKRLDDSQCTKEWLVDENQYYLHQCAKYNCNCIVIDTEYNVEELIVF